MPSSRNKTITLTDEEIKRYASSALFDAKALSQAPLDNMLFHGDTFKACRYLPQASFDLMIADPPYNLAKQYGDTLFSKKSRKDYVDFTKKWIEATLPLLKPNATVYVCADFRTSILLAPILEEYFIIQNRITWQREKGRGASHNFKNAMEDIWFCTLSKEYTFNLDAVKLRRRVLAPYKENGTPKDWTEEDATKYRNTCPSNFWDDITIPYWSMAENTPHPTQKPEKLLAKLILASSNEGDLVFDPFLGSGSTAVSAKKLNRRYFGIEKEEAYIALAEKRLEMAETDKRIQGYENGIFYHRNYTSKQ